MIRGLEQTDCDRVEVVCFPECFLTGYQDTEAAARARILGRFTANNGDSYIIDPFGETVVQSRRLKEQLLFADIDTSLVDTSRDVGRSRRSIRGLSKQLLEAAKIHGKL